MIKRLSLIIMFVLLSSCANLPPPSSKPLALSWAKRQQKLEQLENWRFQGLIAIRTLQDSGSASLIWQQKARSYTISLFGPLGANAVQVYGKPGAVSLETAQGKLFYARSPEQLLYNQTGWNLPVSYLYYWVRGLPVPAIPAQKVLDPYHRLSRLSQDHWQLWFKQYAPFKQNELPTKIVLFHPQLNIKIVIYQWQI